MRVIKINIKNVYIQKMVEKETKSNDIGKYID